MEHLPSEPSLNESRISRRCLTSLSLVAATLLAFAAQFDLLPAAGLAPLWRSLVLASPATGLYGMSVGANERRREWRSDRAGWLVRNGGALVLALGLTTWGIFAFNWFFG